MVADGAPGQALGVKHTESATGSHPEESQAKKRLELRNWTNLIIKVENPPLGNLLFHQSGFSLYVFNFGEQSTRQYFYTKYEIRCPSVCLGGKHTQ